MKSIQEAVASVQNAFPSVYTKDDVVKLLESIEIPAASSGPAFTRERIQELIDAVVGATDHTIDHLDSSSAIDYDSADFDLEYDNRISLHSVELETSYIASKVEQTIHATINEFFNDDIVELEKA